MIRSRCAAIVVAVAVALPLMASAQAATLMPKLALMASGGEVVLERFEGTPVYLDLGVYVAATESPFELRVGRADYTTPVQVEQSLATTLGGIEARELPADVLDGWLGLDDFYSIKITNASGATVVDDMATFCPNNFDRQRVNDEGATNPTYPAQCQANPFTKGMVWGIDAGWATSLTGELYYEMPGGRYTATLAVTDRYVELFDMDPSLATATVSFRVKTIRLDCDKHCEPGHRRSSERASFAQIPVDESPTPSTLPDLIPLPAWNFVVHRGREKTRLQFGATVWTSGNAPLVVEGFRRPNEDLMDGYQYFYEDGVAVGKAQVGSFEFDRRTGHNHWHFLQFARYSLLNADMTEVLLSKKEAFCLASTDAIDLLLPGADWDPVNQDLSSACGTADALWIRESLPLGWGDTYHQSLPGQSFNITELPNGTYYVLVEANPEGLLHESDMDNNQQVREIQLKGRPGNRRVVVPPWNGIDSEVGNVPFSGD